VLMAVYPILYRELIWFGIAAPLFGGSCALLAKERDRRQGVWFVLGFFFTTIAVLALAFPDQYRKPAA